MLHALSSANDCQFLSSGLKTTAFSTHSYGSFTTLRSQFTPATRLCSDLQSKLDEDTLLLLEQSMVRHWLEAMHTFDQSVKISIES